MKRRRRAALARFLRAYLEELRRLYYSRRRHAPGAPCASCAFAPRRGPWRGAEKTAGQLLRLLEAKREGRPAEFLCHTTVPFRDGDWQVPGTADEWARARRCAGFAAIADSPRAHGAARRVFDELRAGGRGVS